MAKKKEGDILEELKAMRPLLTENEKLIIAVEREIGYTTIYRYFRGQVGNIPTARAILERGKEIIANRTKKSKPQLA